MKLISFRKKVKKEIDKKILRLLVNSGMIKRGGK